MKFIFRQSTLCLLFILLAATVTAWADQVDDYVKTAMEQQHIPGVSIAVIKNGKILKTKGYGSANLELNIPVQPETVFKIGSVSKQFLATGIMILNQEGKISLDDPVSKFLEGTPETWKGITVRHLLTHTSGIVREAPGFDPFKIQSDVDVIKTAYPVPLRFVPGEKWEYCNVGYFILAEIIHKVSGQPWDIYLNERIFKPLGMNATRTTTTTSIISNRADGYDWRNDRIENAENYLALRPSGAFLSTVIDLAKWDAALYGDQILKSTTREQMWSPVKLNNGNTHPYGFGWELGKIGNHKLVRHGGSLPGFRADFTRFPDDQLSVVVLTNGDDANSNIIAVNIADFYLSNLLPKRTVAKIDSKIFDTLAGQYQVNNLNAVLKINREGSKLTIQTPAGNFELLPENETDFFAREDRRITCRFFKNEKGEITELAFSLNENQSFKAKKIEK
ncbi:MAG TPA: serine hydrolase [Pyrinomonadaceae bacterium]|nr:serine hydrolase [Pyrinomonadaceae bacterium]